MLYDPCEICGGNSLVPAVLDTGMVLCRDCVDHTWHCDDCCEYFDGRQKDCCPECGSHQIYKADDLKIVR